MKNLKKQITSVITLVQNIQSILFQVSNIKMINSCLLVFL